MQKRPRDQFFVAFVAGYVVIHCPNSKVRFQTLGWFDFQGNIKELCEVFATVLKLSGVKVARTAYIWENNKQLKQALKQFEDPNELTEEEFQSLMEGLLLEPEKPAE
jgi:transcriptional regulator with AAA-type ATPase domain